ncbi:hypothetical protein Athai_31590 [Actinocatenispora thailandica]|uniref:Acyltransferase n=1 Tax=Actinocatenispora thailandica TaxID=227318 RepID=A0A7R7DQ69_9ACTN|nr:acyltransferase domain-containing protein [Actinocatenispora thailandica]BCJ35656.1 hypothetical protein Athai_31590 [Actinocatenispora thailandica]
MGEIAELTRFTALAPEQTGWLAELAAATGPDVALPDETEARRLLTLMQIPAGDHAEALAAAPDPDRDPQLWWLLQHGRRLLAERLGDQAPLARWPELPDRLGAAGRWFYLWTFLAATPQLLAYHQRHGVDAAVSAATLADLGSKAVLRRRTRGAPGLDKQDWFTLHHRGLLYALGRLQFNVSRIRDEAADLAPGTPCLGTHIPETGPMTPADCDASFAAAPEFFAAHFGTRYRIATCTSWLLDDQLAEYLPAGSNILRFQRRFRLVDEPFAASLDGDANVLEFVFRRVDPDLDALPRDTTLQRAVVDHLRAGRHWRVRTGYLHLAAD